VCVYLMCVSFSVCVFLICVSFSVCVCVCLSPNMNFALIFPGQGAQHVGMGRGFYDSSPEAKNIFDQAAGILENNLTDITFNGPAEKLTSTAYCQPAILTTSMAALAAFTAHPAYQKISPAFAAGLSLGEYSALAAAGALTFEDTIKLVKVRAALMEEATRQQAGKMAAIIGMDKDQICAVCAKTGAEIANFNSPQQIVITGHADKVEAASHLLREAGAKSVIPLDVSGAFHSSLMQPAAKKFSAELEKVNIAPPHFPIISNVDARPTTDPNQIRTNLTHQITSPVQWVDTITAMASAGVNHFIELGPGKILSGLIRRIDKSLKATSIQTPKELDALDI